jgi:Fic family protein
MWRLNWIHPFFGGNGRTSRAVSYLALCARLGFRLPGEETIPDQIVANRDPYYLALRAADNAWEERRLDVSQMEALMAELLARQLMAIHDKATNDNRKPLA